MRVELCGFKRCCGCLPLRYGILIIGYLKLIISSAMLVAILYQIGLECSRMDAYIRKNLTWFIAIAVTTSVFLLADIAFAIVYLIGSHKKDAKLLKVFNYYAIGILAFCALAFLIFVGYQMSQLANIHMIIFVAMICREVIAFGIVTFGFHAYMIFLNRSEILKLQSNCNFRFENIASEAQCTMEVGEMHGKIVSVEQREPADQIEAKLENKVNQHMEQKTNGNYTRLSN